jgi:hypothetical protein
MKEYQEFLCEHGKEYRDDVMRKNSVLSRFGDSGKFGNFGKLCGDTHEIFLAEQEMRARTVGGSLIGGSEGSGGSFPQNSRGSRGSRSEVRKETILGLGEHKGISVLRKHQHAPVPWDMILDVEGKRLRSSFTKSSGSSGSMGSTVSLYPSGVSSSSSLNNKLGNEGYGVCQLLDPVMEHVLFSSTKKDHLITILQSLQSFYVPEKRTEAFNQHIRNVCRRKTKTPGTWQEYLRHQSTMKHFLPRALVSWFDKFMKENVASLPPHGQVQFLKTLLHMYESLGDSFGNSFGEKARGKGYRRRERRNEIRTLPIVLDIRVETFYTFIKKEYGLSVHIVDKDPSRDVAVVSFEVTHRYILAIFLDIRPGTFYRTQHKLCTYLLDYLGCISFSGTGTGISGIEEYAKALDRVLDYTIRDCSPKVPGAPEGRKDSGRLMRDMLERRSGVPGKNKETSQRKKRILATRTTGIIEVALYPCSCRRG